MAAYKKKSFTSFKFKKKRAQRRVRRDGQISADRNKSLGGGPRSISFTMPYQSPYKSPTFARGISSSTVGMSLVPFAAKDRFINTRLQVISAMDQFKHYSLEELRYFDGRVLEITAGFGLQTIKRHQQFIFPKGTEVATFSGGKWTLTTNHICITAIERYKDFSLEELRYADLVEQQLVKLDHESHTYLNRKPTQTDTSCWPYHVKGFPFGLTGVEEKTTVNQKLFDDKTRQNQAIAEKSSDDVVGYSPKHYDVTNSANNNNRSDEAEHETKNATDASFFVSVKSASLEKVESDHVLSRIKSMFLDLIENYDSAEITSEFDQKSTASISGSETVILPKHSSADCSTNVFRCNSLSSPDGARNITNDKPDLRSRVFAIGTPFAFKYVPNFGEATTRSTDKTFKNEKFVTSNYMDNTVAI